MNRSERIKNGIAFLSDLWYNEVGDKNGKRIIETKKIAVGQF